MASMTTITCKCGCNRTKEVRTSDVKRGWGKFYSKSCKARHQEQRTGQHKAFQRRQANRQNCQDDFHDADFEYGLDYLSECGDK